MARLQGDIQDLTSYFTRPRLIYSSNITGGLSAFVRQDVDSVVLFNTFFPNGLDRLAGVYGVRFKLVFTLQLATTPYQQGLLCLNWQYGPCASVSTPLGGLTPRGAIQGMQTNVPHVLLDLADTTMGVLKVPYLSVQEFMPLTDGVTDYGTLFISPILPVAFGAGGTVPTMRLYVHIEDLELYGAIPTESAVITLQGGKVLSPVTQEFNKSSHPFSSALNSAGQAFSFLAKGIPSLASIAGPPAWALGQAARLVRYFGYSKPTITEPTNRMYLQSHVNEINVDVPSAATVVGPFADNTLAASPEFAHNGVDEMSLAYILSQYSQLCIGQIGLSDASGARLYASAVSPSSFWFRSRLTGTPPFCNLSAPKSSKVAGAQKAFVPTNIFYIASCFKQWKGSFRFRVTFAKTKFHSGRVLIMYVPTVTSAQELIYPTDTPTTVIGVPPGTFGPQPFGYSKLFDLRDSSVFEFDVPYISPLPYNSFYSPSGSIVMYVQDPLQAPSTVPNVVPFLVEVKAMPDFEVAVPISPLYPPVVAASDTNVRYQSGKLLPVSKPDDAELCTGEKLLSVKQLIMLPKLSYAATVAPNTLDTMSLMPWFYGPALDYTTPVAPTFAREQFGYGFYFSQAYAFVKGGTDYHFYPGNSAGSGSTITVAQISTTPGITVSAGFPSNVPISSNPRVYQANATVGTHVRLPAYQRYVRYWSSFLQYLTWYPDLTNAVSTTLIPYTREGPLVQYSANIQNFSTGTSQFRISRAAADDAALGLYYGPPLLGLLAPDNVNGAYDIDSSVIL
jgi:hypothetical protein